MFKELHFSNIHSILTFKSYKNSTFDQSFPNRHYLNQSINLVDNLQRILEAYRDDPRTTKLISSLNEEKQSRIELQGLSGAQLAFVVVGAYLADPQSFLIVLSDKEEAAYCQNTITSLLEKKPIHLFPDSFKRPMYFEELRSGNALQRTEIINKITSTQTVGNIIVTYPEALFEKVISPAVLEESRIEVKMNENVDVDFLVEMMIEYGFERVDFVYEPGQFSVRGGIIDIFSYGNEWPYRVELFDEEVESIRTFDPTTQLSKRKITSVSIVPNINTKFSNEQKVSLLRVLKENTVVWVKDFQFVFDRLQICFEKAEEFASTISSLDETELAELFRERAFIRPIEIIEDLKFFDIICLNGKGQPIELNEIIEYNSKPQPSFNKNFNLLIQDLSKNERAGIENFIFTDNPKQIERFYAIFEDLNANIKFHPISKAINEGFVDHDLKMACYTDHQIFERFHKYRLRQGFTKDQAINLRMLRELRPGDFVTHIDHGIGRYSGLEKININGHIQESVRLFYKNNDVLYVSINSLHKISKFVGKEGKPPRLSKLGSEAWKALKRKTKSKVKDIAKELIKLYAQRKAAKGFAFPEDGYLQNELEASFIYEDTPDQLKATNDVKADMQKEYPMDRLICGDVGFGKTEVAMRGAFKAVIGGKQVAILVPTTILALQHYKTFSERLDNFGVTVDYINRFRTTKEKKEIFQKLKDGKIDIVIGTHGLLSKDVGFKDLGLLIIDEEQKFGVAAKEKLRNIKVNVDTLTLTATPIPRTLQFSLMAARDLSVIRTPPPNRQPIHTEMRIFSNELIKDAIYYEVNRGGQVFFVHNRVKSLPEIVSMVKKICPDVDIAMAHGQMEAKTLESTLLDFIDRRYEVLVCTNIIETGLDIANANTIIINNAQQFGMSDLHQLRGRVGRSNRKAFCYLFSPPLSVLTPDARKRLKAVEEFSDLGDGFNIAMKDLDIRGAGNMLGGEQSGFISDIGYETYQKILDEAIQELKENEYKDLFKEDIEKKDWTYVRDVQIETDVELLIPDTYVSSVQERLNLYTKIDKIETEEGITEFTKNLVDRFGKLPKEVHHLFDGLRTRWVCKRLGFERLILKNRKLRCYFITNPQSPFYETEIFNNMLQYIATQGHKSGLSFKKSNKYFIMVKDGVAKLDDARLILDDIYRAVSGAAVAG